MTDDQIINVDVYGKDAPAAARFGVGASTLEEINQATEARRDLITEQSDATTRPVRRS